MKNSKPEPKSERRPWGEFHILEDAAHFKCKRLIVEPGQQLSYQSHEQREEHWVFIRGRGIVVLDNKEHQVGTGTYIKIPQQSKHRIRNNGTEPLELIEVQLGDYFGEDDITRYDDDYGR